MMCQSSLLMIFRMQRLLIRHYPRLVFALVVLGRTLAKVLVERIRHPEMSSRDYIGGGGADITRIYQDL